MGGRYILGLTLAAVAVGLASPPALARERRPRGERTAVKERRHKESAETEMEQALEAARRANVRLPSDLQLKYVWSLPLKGHIVDQDYVWVEGDYVVAVSRDRYMHLIRKTDGVALWVMELEAMPMFKPVITERALYVVVENYIVCIDKREGEVRWRKEPKFAVSTAPIVKEPDIYVGSWDKKLHSVEVRSRERVWYRGGRDEDQLKGAFFYFFPTWHLTTKGHLVGDPVEYSGFIYFPSEDGHLYSISRDGDLRYKAPTQGPIKATPTVKEDKAFVGSSDFSLYCFNRLTGAEIWHFPTGSDVLEKPYVDRRSRMVYCPSHKNGIFGINEQTGKQVWHIEDAEQILGVSKDTIYLGLRRNRLLAVDKTSGVALWISLLRGVRYHIENHNDWSRIGKPEHAQIFFMLQGNVIACLEELAQETSPIAEKKAEGKKAD